MGSRPGGRGAGAGRGGHGGWKAAALGLWTRLIKCLPTLDDDPFGALGASASSDSLVGCSTGSDTPEGSPRGWG